MNLIGRLVAQREFLRISQQDVAAKLGVTQSWIAKLESRPEDDLTIGQLRTYAEVVGLKFFAGYGTETHT